MNLSSSGLHLLGTVHSDPAGFRRTSEFLVQYAPDLIFVELSPFALSYRKRHSHTLLQSLFRNLRNASAKTHVEYSSAIRHCQVASIVRQISLPFEYRAAKAFSARVGVPVIPVDYSRFSRQWIQTWEEMIEEENLKQLLQTEPTCMQSDHQYDVAARWIRGEEVRVQNSLSDAESWQRREEHIAEKINKVLVSIHPERPLCIAGWWHLVSGAKIRTLRDLLGIGLSSCHLLDGRRL